MGQTLEEVKEQAKELDRKRKGWFLAAMQKFVTLKPSGTLPCLRKDTLGFGIAYEELKDWMGELGYASDEEQFEVNGWRGDFWDTYTLTSPETHPDYVEILYITGTMASNDYVIMF